MADVSADGGQEPASGEASGQRRRGIRHPLAVCGTVVLLGLAAWPWLGWLAALVAALNLAASLLLLTAPGEPDSEPSSM